MCFPFLIHWPWSFGLQEWAAILATFYSDDFRIFSKKKKLVVMLGEYPSHIYRYLPTMIIWLYVLNSHTGVEKVWRNTCMVGHRAFCWYPDIFCWHVYHERTMEVDLFQSRRAQHITVLLWARTRFSFMRISSMATCSRDYWVIDIISDESWIRLRWLFCGLYVPW